MKNNMKNKMDWMVFEGAHTEKRRQINKMDWMV